MSAMKRMMFLVVGIACVVDAPAAAQRTVGVKDLDRLRDVSDPQLSPDGGWVAYTVSVPDTVKDEGNSDVWMTSWDGARSLQLTRSPADEHAPRWSPDGRYLAFLSDRDDAHESDQLWLLDRSGGEAERVTDLAGGVSDYAWAPDGRRLALVARDPDPNAPSPADSAEHKTPKPIVIDRFQFKEDEVGYLDARRDHLYLLDLSTRTPQVLVPGEYEELSPSWSPDGRSIAFVSRRRPDFDRTDNFDLYVIDAKMGATPRQLTTFGGPDMHPDWGSRAPAWSPDGKQIAYVQGGPLALTYYAGQKVAVVPVAGGPARVLTGALDRNVLSPTWSPDGSSVLFLLEDDRVYHLARVPAAGGAVERLVEGRRVITDLSVGAQGRIAVASSTPAAPAEIYAVEGHELRPISQQNKAWLAEVRLAPVEEISFKSKDGTPINGFLVKPPDYQEGRRYPTILRIHGGPVWQLYDDFANFDWQVLAAQGYVVVGANPRATWGQGGRSSGASGPAGAGRETRAGLPVLA